MSEFYLKQFERMPPHKSRPSSVTPLFKERTFGLDFKISITRNDSKDNGEVLNCLAFDIRQAGLMADGPMTRTLKRAPANKANSSYWKVLQDSSVSLSKNDYCCSEEWEETKGKMNFRDWKDLYHSVELVSPILNEHKWHDVHTALFIMHYSPPYKTPCNQTTSAHVRIGLDTPGKPPLSRGQKFVFVKKIAHCFITFDDFLQLLVPAPRRNKWARRITKTDFAAGKTRAGLCQFIHEKVHNLKSFVNVINN